MGRFVVVFGTPPPMAFPSPRLDDLDSARLPIRLTPTSLLHPHSWDETASISWRATTLVVTHSQMERQSYVVVHT